MGEGSEAQRSEMPAGKSDVLRERGTLLMADCQPLLVVDFELDDGK